MNNQFKLRFFKSSFKKNGAYQVRLVSAFIVLMFVCSFCNTIQASATYDGHDLKQKAKVIDPGAVPERPNLLFEWGEGLFEIGKLDEPWVLPTGAVWSPALWVFGGYQVAYHYQKEGRADIANSGEDINVLTNRLDLFAQLRLSGTERILIGFRPLDDVYGNAIPAFTHYNFSPNTQPADQEKENTEFNADVTTLFFEGDLGEIFPSFDQADRRALDFGFSVGRQRIRIQDGMLMNDNLDTIGIIRNTILTRSTNDMSVTALYAWNQINRSNGLNDDSARLYGLFTDIETFDHSIELDLIFVDDTADDVEGVFGGLSSTQRMGPINSTFRGLVSYRTKDSSTQERNNLIGNGILLSSELSLTPHGRYDLAYLNTFYGIRKFTAAARGNSVGGAIGNIGILFAGVGVGPYVSPIDNIPQETYGFALGYQFIFAGGRRQLIFEVAGKKNENLNPDLNDSAAVGARLQQAIGQHYIVQFDTYYSMIENLDDGIGARAAFRVKF